jgi:UDP-xylose:glucoside alpha-1,3-xylosyltransferase
MFKPCSTARLFTPSILHDVDAVVYTDLDFLFLAPIEELWSHFRIMDERMYIGAAQDNEKGSCLAYYSMTPLPARGPMGLNAGLLLLNLTRMRRADFVSEAVDIYVRNKWAIFLIDQDIINIFVHYRPEAVLDLTCNWNYQRGHCAYVLNQCHEAVSKGIFVLHGCTCAFVNRVFPTFKAVYETFRDFDESAHSLEDLLDQMNDALGRMQVHCNAGPQLFTKSLEKIVSRRLNGSDSRQYWNSGKISQ